MSNSTTGSECRRDRAAPQHCLDLSAPREFQVQVRELIDFALRTGDLGGGRDFVTPKRARAGIRGHQRIQKSRPEGYEREKVVSFQAEEPGFRLTVQGRIDGVLKDATGLLLEEIKTVDSRWQGSPDPLHWAQAKCYAYMLGQSTPFSTIRLQLTYLDLDTGKTTELVEVWNWPDLADFFDRTLAIYLGWIRQQVQWLETRDSSIRSLPFPFAKYRPGQRELAVAAYKTIVSHRRIFLEAPTGIGKTVSVLFPAIKALAATKVGRVFYLTARTSGRQVAEKAIVDLRGAGLRLRGLTLTAKEKMCVQNGEPCDASTCPLARGYYDRRRPAMLEALEREQITRSALEGVASAHRVCPFELGLDLSTWVDVVIGDYNYVFDPRVYLRRHFDTGSTNHTFLIDEAHNLVDRAREMFSAQLETRRLRETARALRRGQPKLAKALDKVRTSIAKLTATSGDDEDSAGAEGEPSLDLFSSKAVTPDRPSLPRTGGREDVYISRQPPSHIIELVDKALGACEAWLSLNEETDFRPSLLECYFGLLSFQRTADLYDENFATLCLRRGRDSSLKLACLDPSSSLGIAYQRGDSALLFSATLAPLGYYTELLGGSPGDKVLRLPCPFSPDHLGVFVQTQIRTEYRDRAASLPAVVQAILTTVSARRGNYLVYFPSYEYLNHAHSQLKGLIPDSTKLLAQSPAMTETEREQFLSAFSTDHQQTLVGLAVMGGVFGEGIDLVGEKLIGAVVVGVGLPQLCAERDLIRDYFQQKLGFGFEYAYTYPGLNRVLQATGRVIRSESDKGVVVLIDTRFGQVRYREMLPSWWRPQTVRTNMELFQALGGFWERWEPPAQPP